MKKDPEKVKKEKRRLWRRIRNSVLAVVLVSFLAVSLALPFSKKARAYADPFYIMAFLTACGLGGTCLVIDNEALALNTKQYIEEKGGFIEQILKYASIFTVWLDLKKLLGSSLDDQDQAEKADATVNPGTAGQMQLKVISEVALAQSTEAVQNEELGAHMAATAEAPPPLPSEQFICNQIMACQGPMFMEMFARGVSKMILEGMSLRYRGAGEDGSGPQYSRREFENRTGKGAGEIRTFAKIDGVEEGLRALTSSSMTSFADRDISAVLFSRNSVLQLPPMKEEKLETEGGTIVYKVPDLIDLEFGADRYEQESFLTAVRYCYIMAGPRPTPPSGKQMDTLEGRTKKVMWNICASKQDAFLKQCADRIGKLTRPDCSSNQYEDFCQATMHTCNAGRKTMVTTLPQSFRNCAAGANLYQSEYLCSLSCGASRRYQAGVNLGADHAAMMADIALCGVVRNSWEKKLDAEERNFMRAVGSMQNIDECWKKAGF